MSILYPLLKFKSTFLPVAAVAPGSVSRCPPVDPGEMDDEVEAVPVEVVQAENVVATRTGMSGVRFTIYYLL